jgi:putative endonuclease
MADPVQPKTWHIYLLKDSKGHFYTGITTDVEARFAAHKEGKGAKYTRSRRGLKLVFQCPCGTKSEASKAEWAVKQLTHAQKADLVAGRIPLAQVLGVALPAA